MAASDFNRNHPELQEGEVFITNAGANDTSWHQMIWKTKRMGNVAYSKHGEQMPSLRPIFVQISELEAKDITPTLKR